jgi:mannan endo-1,4-beta-mannosidase
MLFDRLVNYHKLNNLLWVYNANEVRGNYMDPYADFYPGHDYVDILATDVYSGKYLQEDYNSLVDLAEGKPVALGEVGKLPTPEILKNQPKWAWYMVWVDFVFRSNKHEELEAIFKSDIVLTREEILDNE